MLLFGGLRTILNCRMPQTCIADPDNDVRNWEIITKVNIGKLILPEPSQSYIPSGCQSI